MNDINTALGELIKVAAELVRCDGLPDEEDATQRVGKRRVGRMRSRSIDRGVRIRDAADTIRRAMKGGAQ